MHFDSNQMRGFLRRSSYGADNSLSSIKQVQNETMYNKYAEAKTTKNQSLPFRSIPRNQKGAMKAYLPQRQKEQAFHPMISDQN